MGNKAFRSVEYNTWLIAESDKLHAHPDLEYHGAKGHFHVVKDSGGKIALKTHHGHYVAVDQNHRLYLAHNDSHEDTKFFLEEHGNHEVSIHSHAGGYLAVDHEGHVYVEGAPHRNARFFEVAM